MLDRRSLTKLITRLENGKPLPRNARARTGRAHIIGITGPPGVGKSSLIDRLMDEFRRHDQTVAVVAVDPSSAISGGAFLGDRVRMQRHSNDPGVFIRSLATRQHHGGLAQATPRIVRALDAAGFDIILIETIGAGQDEVEIADVADTVVVVLMPEMGDAVQRAKAGWMEIADIVAINKSDLMAERASGLRPSARHKLEAGATSWQAPTLHVSAKTGSGVTGLHAVLDEHRRFLARSAPANRKRKPARIGFHTPLEPDDEDHAG
jgi:LAO/AO transport system kinase